MSPPRPARGEAKNRGHEEGRHPRGLTRKVRRSLQRVFRRQTNEVDNRVRPRWSSSRIHQLLNAPEGKENPVWLSQLRQSSRGPGGRKKAKRPESETEIRSRLAREVEVLRRCTDWLQRLERGENVVVNLRLDEDFETEFVAFDRPRVVRVLERIAADLDNLKSKAVIRVKSHVIRKYFRIAPLNSALMPQKILLLRPDGVAAKKSVA